MILAIKRKIGIPKQRGFWLRCFLSGILLCIVLCAARAGSLRAQLDLPGPERLTHVEGVIVNDNGHPVADLEITLAREEQIAYRTQTDNSGHFRFEHVHSGPYVLRVKRSTSNAPAERQIVITDEVVTVLERKKLYVILGPGACQDACSSILTSKRDFDRAIRKLTRH